MKEKSILGKTVKIEARVIGMSVENGELYVRLSKEEGKSILAPEHWVELVKDKGGEKEDGVQSDSPK